MKRILTRTEQQTKNIAAELAQKLQAPAVICLWGDLGSGKTTFSKGFAAGLGLEEKNLKSPTYTFMRKYQIVTPKSGKQTDQKRKASVKVLYHCDFYRIQEVDDLLTRDLEEIFHEHNAFILIEWPERIKSLLPSKSIDIFFEYIDAQTRKITIHD